MKLTGEWRLSSAAIEGEVAFAVPGDVHSALLAAGKITDPYWRDTEVSLDWVHEAEWVATRSFALESLGNGRYFMTFQSVDTIAELRVNGIYIGKFENQFIRYSFDVTEALRAGENTVSIHFASNSREAVARANASEIEVPYIAHNCRIPYTNFLRKTQCHAGWDWNIAILPLGIYGDVTLSEVETFRLDDVSVRQTHEPNAVTVEVTAHFDVFDPMEDTLTLEINGQTETAKVKAWPGTGAATVAVTIENPDLWWPAGHGAQTLYDVKVSLGSQSRSFKLGLRQVELITDKDEVGARFAFRVNGREIFMRGANWIPTDALPSRDTIETTRDLLTSAREANMNMLRIWGGGEYEADWFYAMCDEMGLMVWQDFMFACNAYPGHDRDWLRLVKTEAEQQVRRLSKFASLAVWCGDNELVGALSWFKETKADRDRYLAMYDRLNHTLEMVVDDERPDVPFWPSSPSIGRLNFGDGWHLDTSGDMHFWSVWHEAKDFEHYRTVRPRFCSEFGFQSFPSNRLIETFTLPEDRNVSSKVMDVHQRNIGGNARIVETITRYFRFPDGFEDMVYLSQLSHGLAMKTAIEFWRANKPHTMGTLYWQINDTWPVASWASLEYGGGWKTVHYMAKGYFADVLVTAQPDAETGDTVLWAINDTPSAQDISLRIRAVTAGKTAMRDLAPITATIPTDRAIEIGRIPQGTLGAEEFIVFAWTGNGHAGENYYLPLRPKAYDFGSPKVTATENADGSVTLTSDLPALYVTWDHGGDTVYSDNCVTLLPGEPKTLLPTRQRTSHLPKNVKEVKFLGAK